MDFRILYLITSRFTIVFLYAQIIRRLAVCDIEIILFVLPLLI